MYLCIGFFKHDTYKRLFVNKIRTIDMRKAADTKCL